MASQQEEPKTIPLKILIDKQINKVIVIEATKHFIDTLFSFLSLPLATIIRLTTTNDHQQQPSESESPEPVSPPLGSIQNLYQSVENLTPNDVWNPTCKQMLLHPTNPCASLCSKLFLNVDDTAEPSTRFYVCDSCDKFTTFRDLVCSCGRAIKRVPRNLDSVSQGNDGAEGNSGVFVRENGSLFLVFDDLTIVPSSLVTSMQMLMELGYSDLSQLEEQTCYIGKQEILNLLRYTLTTHEPLTKTILGARSKKKDIPQNQFADAVRARTCTSDSEMDVKLVRSKSREKIIFAEASEDFVDFIFSFLAMPLGSIIKLLDGNSFVGCVDNLYKSVEALDSSWCTDSRCVLLNPGLAPQFGCPKQTLNIPEVKHPTYYYGTKRIEGYKDHYGNSKTREVTLEGGGISKSQGSFYKARLLTALDPRSPNRSKEGVVGFVKRPALYGVGDDLTVKPLSASSCLSYLKELSLPLNDLEVKVISIDSAEALSLVGASLTSTFTLTSGLKDFVEVPKQESNLTSKFTHRLDELSKQLKPES